MLQRAIFCNNKQHSQAAVTVYVTQNQCPTHFRKARSSLYLCLTLPPIFSSQIVNNISIEIYKVNHYICLKTVSSSLFFSPSLYCSEYMYTTAGRRGVPPPPLPTQIKRNTNSTEFHM